MARWYLSEFSGSGTASRLSTTLPHIAQSGHQSRPNLQKTPSMPPRVSVLIAVSAIVEMLFF